MAEKKVARKSGTRKPGTRKTATRRGAAGKTNAARAFLDKVDKDPALQHEIKKIHADYVKLGAIHGHSFSLKELHDELGRRWGVTSPPPYDDPDTCTCI